MPPPIQTYEDELRDRTALHMQVADLTQAPDFKKVYGISEDIDDADAAWERASRSATAFARTPDWTKVQDALNEGWEKHQYRLGRFEGCLHLTLEGVRSISQISRKHWKIMKINDVTMFHRVS